MDNKSDKETEKKPFKDRIKNAFTKKKLKGFFDRYGFYIALLLCVCIVGATAVFANGGGTIDDTNDKQAEATEAPPTDSGDIIIIDKGDDEQGQNEDNSENDNDDSTDASAIDPIEEETQGDDTEGAISASGDKTVEITMIMPVDGDILKGYTNEDELVFSETLKQWSTHKGIDIGGAIGNQVKAALDGTVESIDEDALRGIEIILKHDNNITTVYTGVSTSDMVKIGQQVTQGQVISGIGQTAAFEILDPTHLHFEVLIDGEHQDPMDFIKE